MDYKRIEIHHGEKLEKRNIKYMSLQNRNICDGDRKSIDMHVAAL